MARSAPKEASLIRDHQLVSNLAQYQAVRNELAEIGDLARGRKL